ncbi:MAG TPA: ATP-dependent DNA helicase RecG [Cyanobacteria bacterium UBA12227]|nr:ATP-dependent DNA helicase RecG [Cyanobacteria bacterium UBA12227]HAX86893.1 ATP-dependent DNA helicase RecG [Cyanobacteria bacterium UBA11370]HBY78656.1 ATP-dependent DNA helicase RecG [Cyanobacteria bacterium UBA11148]
MSIELANITTDQLNHILQSPESHFLELKSIDIQPAKLSKFISGFANADGGEIYIGIDEVNMVDIKTRSWRGFPDQEAANGHLQLFEQLFPLGDYYSYIFLTSHVALGLVLQVIIHKSREIVTASDGTPYIRRGAQTLPVKNEQALERLKLDKGIESFERKTIDVDLELLTNSIAMTKFISATIPTAEAETWLKKQQLLQRNKPTVAGVLLFADEPQAILPKRCGVKIYRYKTKDSEGTRDTLAFNPITIEGCLYEQIEQTVAKTIQIVEEIPKVGASGLESINYPEEAIHEIITNAVLHRDYSILSDVHIRIFDDRLEIESPGRLPGHVTVRNILKEQYARNGAIVRIINKFPNPPNKDVGEGLNTAFQAMAKLRLKPPEIHETETSVVIHIKHEPLASIEATIIEYLDTHDRITNKIARQQTGIRSEGTIKVAFCKLRDRGLIEPVPGRAKSQAAWRKVKDTNDQEESLSKIYDLYPQYEQVVMEYLANHEQITNEIGRQITGIGSGATMKTIFYRLKRKGLIETVPGRSRMMAAWRKVK